MYACDNTVIGCRSHLGYSLYAHAIDIQCMSEAGPNTQYAINMPLDLITYSGYSIV